MDANRNQAWARVLFEELAASGVTEVCVAPGSRSTPLVFAAEADARLRVRVFLDERSAAFFALGIGKATGRPAAVVTTSGTAVANLLPAVVEASQSESPLLLLTADRPHRLRDADANQAIRQPGIFGEYTREAWDLSLPSMEVDALRHLRSVGCRAVAAAVGLPAGPVHLNLPFEKPLEPTRSPGDVPTSVAEDPVFTGRSAGPWTRIDPRVPRADDRELDDFVARISDARAPVLVAGPDPRAARLGPVAVRFAAQAGMPVLADPLSGARWGPGHGAVRPGHYDLFLRDDEIAGTLEADLVIRIGRSPTSAALGRWIARGGAEVVGVDAAGRWKDHAGLAHRVFTADPVDLLARAAGRIDPRPASWRRRWESADEAAAEALASESIPPHEGRIARAVVEALEEGGVLFLSSSMPIRDVDGFSGSGIDAVIEAHGNRGASGIDGIVSTALGVAAGSGRRTLALVGDLALLHDSNGLLAARESDAEVLFVVVNNDGGGIFHMLPVRDHEPVFTRCFATPHGVDLGRVAAAWGVEHRRVDAGAELGVAIAREWHTPGTRMLEIRTDREENRIGHERAVEAVTVAVRAALMRDGG